MGATTRTDEIIIGTDRGVVVCGNFSESLPNEQHRDKDFVVTSCWRTVDSTEGCGSGCVADRTCGRCVYCALLRPEHPFVRMMSFFAAWQGARDAGFHKQF